MEVTAETRNAVGMPMTGFGVFQLSEDEMARLGSFDRRQYLAWASSGTNPMEDYPPLAQS